MTADEYYSTGLAFLQLDAPESAVDAFHSALDLKPRDPSILVRGCFGVLLTTLLILIYIINRSPWVKRMKH